MTRMVTNWLRAIVTLAVVTGIGRADHPKPQTQEKATMAVPQSTARLREAEEDYRRGLQAADGIGVPQDYLAAAKEMTPAQLTQARQLAAQKRKSPQAKEANRP